MRILFVCSEVVPFAKSGGLADVAGGLAKALATAGHEVVVVLPRYRQLIPAALAGKSLGQSIEIPIGAERRVTFELYSAEFPTEEATAGNLRVILLDQPHYFDRPAIYTERGADYPDNCERFVAFSRAALTVADAIEWIPEVVHAHDWQTGLVPALLAVEWRKRPGWEETASVFTIHNIAFQGRFWRWDMLLTGLDWQYFNWRQMEFYGDLNLLKTGVVFADQVTTVSPTYAHEICTPQYGNGLESVLAERQRDLVGILNGVDTTEWNPETDHYLPAHFSRDQHRVGKPACKRAIQEQCHLTVDPIVPLAVMISRMTEQKGFDLIASCADELLATNLQLVFLGTGDQRFSQFLTELSHRYPGRVATFIGFDESLAHRLEAAGDLFLMPSRFEPCGLNQQYSQIYGTVPIVHAVGGLADSVSDAGGPTASSVLPDGTGFVFRSYTREAFLEAVQRALAVYCEPTLWHRIMRNGMSRDWSWRRSATEYVKVYEQAATRLRNS